MKKYLSVILSGLIAVPALTAQSLTPALTLDGSSPDYIPSQYTVSGKPIMVLTNENDNGSTDLKLYDENLSSLGSLAIPGASGTNGYTETRYRVFAYNPQGYKGEEYLYNNATQFDDEGRPVWTLEGVRQQAKDFFGANVTETVYNGRTVFYPTVNIPDSEVSDRNLYWNYWELGASYPAVCFSFQPSADNSQSGTAFRINLYNESYLPTDRFGDPIREYDGAQDPEGYMELEVKNFNTGCDDNLYFIVTQTLLNDDAEYEYIAPVYSLGLVNTEQTDYYIRSRYGLVTTGFEVKNTSGSVLGKYDFPAGITASYVNAKVAIIGDKTYLTFISSNYSTYEYYNIFYSVNGAAGLQQVGEPIKVSVSPTVVRQSETLNVQLGDIKGNARVTVTDMQGRTVYSAVVNQGGLHQIPGSVMGKGMNIVSVESAGTPGRTAKKVMVR